MEIKEAAERLVIAIPVASKPSCSTFRSFSELLLAGDSSPARASCSDTTFVAAIRPKTVRVSKTSAGGLVASCSSQSHSQVGLGQSLDTAGFLVSDAKSTVVYKPLAKLVSKSTVSLLANMGNFSTSPPQALVEPQPQQLSRPQGLYLRLPQPSRLAEASRGQPSSQKTDEDPKSVPLVANVHRPSYDGYNWKKYGQKQVKGSEYPRSYYKCTQPNCPVKKKVERSFDGQITEIVYKGEHNHVKPEHQPPKKNTPAGIVQGNESEGARQDFSTQFVNDARDRVSDQKQNDMMRPSAISAYQASNPVPSFDNVVNAGLVMTDNSCDHGDGSKGIDADDDEPRTKIRKSEVQASPSGGQVPNIVVQSSTDTEIVGDGHRWRKYGQKVVKSNPYPRSYYRCTSLNCNVRKHVERASEDPRSFITTYEGKHNHDMPARSATQAASEPGSQQIQACKDRK